MTGKAAVTSAGTRLRKLTRNRARQLCPALYVSGHKDISFPHNQVRQQRVRRREYMKTHILVLLLIDY